ncbi:MAG: CUB domain-containing protein [Saprospiraceae bacterium]
MKKLFTLLLISCLGMTALLAQQKGKVKQTEPDFTNFVNPFQTKDLTESPKVIRPENVKSYAVTDKDYTYFIKFSEKPIAAATMETIRNVFELRQQDYWQFKTEMTDNLGFTHRRYQQQYLGLDVFGGEIIVHQKDGKIQKINGHFYPNIQTNVIAGISEQAAIAKAKRHIGAEQWQWETGNETYYNQMTGGSLQPTGTLTLIPENGDFRPGAFRLAYKVNINAQKPYGAYDVYVDAANGQVIWKLDKIATNDVTGSAVTLYSGTQTITMDDTGNGYRLRESGRGIETKNMNNGTNFNNAVDFTNSTTTWTASGIALSSVTINQINNNWYTNFNENPNNGGKPDLFIAIFDGNNNIYQSATTWNQDPPVTISNINLNVPAGQTYTVEIYDNDNSVFSHDFLGSFTISGGASGTQNFSDSGNSGTYTVGTAGADPALDAHWGMEQTYDFFSTKFNRDSYDGNGATIRNFVHFDNAMENAFWDPNLQALVFGDGASTFSPLTSIDVAGHEFSHAVITNTADLIYQSESGALNESFADIFGVAIEAYAKPNSTGLWEIGDEITLTAPGYLRSMSNPNSGLSQQPDTYGGTHWADPANTSFDNGGVHINSGVQNYWYYLLSAGGSGTNDLGNAFNVNGIGIDSATAIAYRNLTVYLTQSSDFADAVTGSIQAAQDLYGVNSSAVTSVQNAWYAVGLGSASSPTAFCGGLTTLTAASDVFSDGSGSADYQDNANCSWLIQPAGANQVTLTFNNFDTETGYDTVSIYDGVNANAPLLMTWSGNAIPSAVTSTTGAMFVTFISDGSQTDAGWEASYTSSGTAFCNGGTTLTGQTGSFSDGSGASNYANNAFCYWNIAPAGATTITLNFSAFDTEATYDGVIVYDGETVNDTELLNWSGTVLPPSVTSTGSKMLVVFTSDATQTEAGFDANYTVTGGNTYCSTATVTEDFTVIEDGSANNNYYDNTLCTWLIQPPNAEAIDLYFTAFDLENASPDGQTIYDAVEIYDGVNDSAPLLATYFGSNIPPVTSSTGGSMFIKFYSDASVNLAGWEAYFVSQTQSFCQGNTDIIGAGLTGTISDGSAADDYGNSSECTWTLQATPPENVMLTFTDFDTEANFDFVIVYDGINDTAPILGSYSGTNLPPQIVSSDSDMFVVFVSDESVTAEGFEANYEMLFVSTDALVEQYELAIFPNPFNNQLTIEFDLDKVENIQLELFDILGRRVYQEDLGKRHSGENQHFINTNDLTKGAYILKLKIGEQEINQKVVKLK